MLLALLIATSANTGLYTHLLITHREVGIDATHRCNTVDKALLGSQWW